ncbi:MAG TPA: hypothetical protein VFJ82_03515 [Longimicrobium sp.]|nr:hypothetical protein [Longimicrobium sp.]
MSLTRIRPSVLGAAVFTLGIAACDSRELLAPDGRSPATARSYISEPQSLGSGFLAAPPNTSPASVGGIGWAPLQAFPDSAWIVVNVSGNISLAYNKAPCDSWAESMPLWACMTGDPFDGFGAQPWDGGTVSIRAYYDGGGGGYTPVKLRGTGGTGAVGLFFAPGAGSLTGRFNMRGLWAWDPTFGTGPWSYNIAGGYTVAATAVPAPFQVTESAPDADGVVTYTVAPLYGLQFTTPVNGWPDGATFWAFYPGDSLPDRPDRSWPGWQITECQFKLVCQWKPPVAGRMQVLAHLEDQPAYARSKPAPPPASIQVTCTPTTVVRGGSIVCEANARPRGSLQVTKWWFDDGNGHLLRPSDPQQDSADFWGGRMAVSGTVHVEGEIDGHSAPGDSAQITVVARRPWGLAYPARPSDTYTRDSLQYPPVMAYGQTIGNGVLGKFRGASLKWIPALGTGPNEGVMYVQSIQWDTARLFIWINAGLQPTDPWYQAQVGPTRNRPNGCGTAFLEREAAQVPVHEGTHYNIDRVFFEDSTTFAPLEPAVEFKGSQLGRIRALIDSIYARREVLQNALDAVDKGIQDCDPYPLPTH